MMLFIYAIVLGLFSLYSYSLIDVNLTLFNNRYWEIFRNQMVSLGYLHRDASGLIYLAFVILFFFFHFYFLRRYKDLSILKLSLIIGVILLFSYPFISHDFFNYIFDAKILTFYHKIPYFFRAQDFPNDAWLRFLHWTHRKYPYGPIFLIITAFPSFFAFNKFILNFFFFKLLFISSYVLAVYCLNKLNKKWAVVFATHPLIIVEGLANTHNDIIGVSLAIIGIYFLWREKNILARLFFLASAGIKFITIPIIIASKNNKRINQLMLLGFILVMIYASLTLEIQPWYFLNFFAFLPFFAQEFQLFNLLTFELLFSNYFYIRYGVINESWQMSAKTTLFFVFFVINLGLVFVKYFIWQKPSKKAKYILSAVLLVAAIISRFYVLNKTAVWGALQLQALPAFFYSFLREPWLLTAIIPTLFVISTILVLFIRVDFWVKVFYLIFLISAQSFLFYSRYLSVISLILVLSLIIFHAVLLLIKRKWLTAKFMEQKGIWPYLATALLTIFTISNFILYFYQPTSVFSLETQNQLANVIAFTENKEYLDNKNRSPLQPDKVRINIYPESDNIKGLEYILKIKHDLNNSRNIGRRYIICYSNACSMERKIISYKLIVDNLRLPTGEKFKEYEIEPIYEIEGKLIVIIVR